MYAIKLLASIAICLGAGFVGSLFTRESVSGWYVVLKKPFFTPPDWVFAPAWTILYILMGISLFIVAKNGFKDDNIKQGICTFFVQLALNILWSIVFFGCKAPLAGLIVIIVLLLAIIHTAVSFYRISRTASLLFIPYILWVSFASLLNFFLWAYNR